MIPTFLQPVAMRLDHRFTVRHASEFIDGDLSPAASARIRRHASVCPMCAELLQTMRATISNLRRLASPNDTPSVVPSILDALRADATPSTPRTSEPPPPPPPPPTDDG
jgi:Putative zinc-finger